MKKFTLSTWFYFLVPSILGILLFMIPLKFDGDWKVPIAIFADLLSGSIAPVMPWAATITLIIAALGSIVFLAVRKDNAKPSFMTNLFKVSLFWTIVRIIGAIFAVLTMLQVGPEAIWNENTGGLLLSEDGGLVTFLFTIFLIRRTSLTTSSKFRFT